jgi:hypothetical protein
MHITQVCRTQTMPDEMEDNALARRGMEVQPVHDRNVHQI